MNYRYLDANGKGDSERGQEVKREMRALSTKSTDGHIWKMRPAPAPRVMKSPLSLSLFHSLSISISLSPIFPLVSHASFTSRFSFSVLSRIIIPFAQSSQL